MKANLHNADQHYIEWLKKCRRLLGRPVEDVADGEWRYGWHVQYICGNSPAQAVENARAELRDRGLGEE